MNLIKLKEVSENINKTLTSTLRIIFLSKFTKKFSPVVNHKNELLILGNGPSLKSVLEHGNELIKHDLLVVNHFPETEYFKILKPQYLLVPAPELFMTDVDTSHIERSSKLFSSVAKKTEWELILFVPYYAKKQLKWRREIEKNSFIKIKYYNNVPMEGMLFFRKFAFNYRLGLPRPHNVIVPAITLGMWMNYKKIIMIGTEHSWLKNIFVTEKNQVFIDQKHFYTKENDNTISEMHKSGKGVRKLHEILEKFLFTFRSYFEIKDIAKSKNIKILNGVPDSYIDAFDKVDFIDIIKKRNLTE